MTLPLAFEKIWFMKSEYNEAEEMYFQKLAQDMKRPECSSASKPVNINVADRLVQLEKKQEFLSISLKAMHESLEEITKEIKSLKVGDSKSTVEAAKPPVVEAPPAPKAATPAADSDSDEVDLFGSDDEEEDAEAARVREERLKAYADKKAKKPGPIAKSSVLLDVKPWDDETDMAKMEKIVRSIEMDGLTWAAGKLVPLAFGIQKLSILCIVEDEKVSIEDLSEKIESFEDYVQSVDISAFNKI